MASRFFRLPDSTLAVYDGRRHSLTHYPLPDRKPGDFILHHGVRIIGSLENPADTLVFGFARFAKTITQPADRAGIDRAFTPDIF